MSQAVVLPRPYAGAGPCHVGPWSSRDAESPRFCKMEVGNGSFSGAYGGNGFPPAQRHAVASVSLLPKVYRPPRPGGELISSCAQRRHNSIGVTAKSPAWAKPRYAQPSERKRKLVTSSWMQKENVIAGLVARLRRNCASAEESKEKWVQREKRAHQQGRGTLVPAAWTACTNPRGKVSWLQGSGLRVTRPRACTAEGKLFLIRS